MKFGNMFFAKKNSITFEILPVSECYITGFQFSYKKPMLVFTNQLYAFADTAKLFFFFRNNNL